MTAELDALRSVDFVWTRQLKTIWRDQPYHVDSIHHAVREDLLTYFVTSTRDQEPGNEALGRIVIGPAGLGKTHLMGELRRKVWELEGTFILLDLVGIKDFWSSVALAFLNSLQVRLPDGRTQYDRLILRIASSLALESQLIDIAARLRGRPRQLIAELVRLFLSALMQRDRESALNFQDVVRALVLLDSDDLECASVAHAWLQGMDLDPEEVRGLGFVAVKKPPIEIVRGICWLLGLIGPTLIAIDQIDPIISEANVRAHNSNDGAGEEQARETRSIIEALANGLMELHEIKRRAVIVVSCLEASWRVLEEKSTVAVKDRYRAPTILKNINQAGVAQSLVGARLTHAYSSCGFTPRYQTWPFSPSAFERTIGLTPRELLKACEDHRQACLSRGTVFECASFDEMPAEQPDRQPRNEFDDTFDRQLEAAEIEGLLDPQNEDRLRGLFTDVLQIYTAHLAPPNDVDVLVQPDPDQKRPSLHGRLTFIFRSEGDREQHFCFRVLAHSNAIAFQSRLRAAMTASGVDHALKFRHLFILRRDAPPAGAKTRELVEKFHRADGKFVVPTEQDLRTFVALQAILKDHPDGFDGWLRSRRPLFDTPLFKAAELCPPSFLRPGARPGNGARTSPPPADDALTPPPSERAQQPPPQDLAVAPDSGVRAAHEVPGHQPMSRDIPLGHRYERGASGAAVTLSADLLPRHVAILAGSGSGKTVLLRRIVEEAALLGLPAIVLDTNNDLARLGDPWPERPDGWTDADAARAADYQRNVEVVIWTPGRAGGRPMSLALLPDFGALGDDPDERAQAIEMARATLAPFIGASGAGAKLKEGVLADALRRFSHEDGSTLAGLIELLSDLPDDVSQIGNARRLASAIADQLRAAVATNPLMQSRGADLDPQSLLHGDAHKTRISVINFSGLASDEARASFVNQLQMSLFTWIRRNPSRTGRLYVLDEAQNFAPSQKSTPCKESTVALAAQARKYGLGMIFATQAPKGIDNKIVSNCTTQFYGRMSAPATIEAIRELMSAKGGSGEDIGRLSRGEFYFSTEATPRPLRIRTPLCLTWHPPNPLPADEVVAKARHSDAA